MTTYPQTRWSLVDLVPNGSDETAIKQSFDTLTRKIEAFEARRADLKPDISLETFLAIARELEAITRDVNYIYGYTGLWFAENTQNQAAQTLSARTDQFVADLSNRTLFFSLWWKELDEENAGRLMAGAGDYRYWLEEMRLFKKYTLSEPEEKIVNLKDVTGSSALKTLYDTITNRYTFKMEVDGELRELTRGQLMVYARHYNPDLRKAAYQEQFRVYGNDGVILGQMYQTLVRDWRNEQVNLRGFKSPIAARNLANNIPDEVVDTLLAVCARNAPVFQRFFGIKARWLGMERLRRYDVYAPVARSEKAYPFGEAANMVFEAFNEFDPKFAAMAEQVFARNHLDGEVRKGKRDGAFCWSVAPELTPWVLLNYQGKASDVAVMAHELGHAIHSQMASGHSILTFRSSLPMAETASTFGEMMLVERLLKQEPDESIRREILFRQVDDAYATILRQAYFAMFERTAHELVNDGASVDDLAAAYQANLKSQFGEALDVADEFKWEWVSIPHIFDVPFYVYAYSFGQLLVLSLYQQYRAEGNAFKPRYFRILEAGGSEAPVRLLAEAGIDITQDAFWQGGFDAIARLVDQLEALPVLPASQE
ncbi:MAG TPA: M3 family oligoendopeptidase [Anaerolineaceae bacterium]